MAVQVPFRFKIGDAVKFTDPINGAQCEGVVKRLRVRTITAIRMEPTYLVETTDGQRFMSAEAHLSLP